MVYCTGTIPVNSATIKRCFSPMRIIGNWLPYIYRPEVIFKIGNNKYLKGIMKSAYSRAYIKLVCQKQTKINSYKYCIVVYYVYQSIINLLYLYNIILLSS